MTRLALLVLGVLAVLALGACSQQPPEVEANAQVPADQRTEAAAAGGTEGGGEDGGGATWVAVDIDFESAPSELPGGPVEITLDNQGSTLHNVTIPEVQPDPLVEAPGGESASATVELEPGTYEYHCSVPGHETLMSGEVTVG